MIISAHSLSFFLTSDSLTNYSSLPEEILHLAPFAPHTHPLSSSIQKTAYVIFPPCLTFQLSSMSKTKQSHRVEFLTTRVLPQGQPACSHDAERAGTCCLSESWPLPHVPGQRAPCPDVAASVLPPRCWAWCSKFQLASFLSGTVNNRQMENGSIRLVLQGVPCATSEITAQCALGKRVMQNSFHFD